jgi:hypothetical protein
VIPWAEGGEERRRKRKGRDMMEKTRDSVPIRLPNFSVHKKFSTQPGYFSVGSSISPSDERK